MVARLYLERFTMIKYEWLVVTLLLSSLALPLAWADTGLLPASRDEQYRTFGLFIDNQSTAIFEPTGNNVWLALGEEVPLLEKKDWYGSPQLLVFASINAGDRLNGSTTF